MLNLKSILIGSYFDKGIVIIENYKAHVISEIQYAAIT